MTLRIVLALWIIMVTFAPAETAIQQRQTPDLTLVNFLPQVEHPPVVLL